MPGQSSASQLRRALRSALAAAWAATGTALIAIMIAIAAGGATYALNEPEPPPTPPASTATSTEENVRVALQAADDSRTIFGVLSNAVTASTAGINSALAGVPQVFDSVESARIGATQVSAGLAQASTATAALDEVAQSAAGWSSTLNQLEGLAGLSTAVRTSSVQLRDQLVANPVPGSEVTVAQLDNVLAATNGLDTLAAVNELQGSLASLTNISDQSDAALASAQTSANQLRDGLTEIANARPSAQTAMDNISLGLTQLSTALASVDQQLALVQQRLQAETVAMDEPIADVPIDNGTRMAWALMVAGIAGALTYLLALAAAHLAPERRPAPITQPDAPLADLARVISEIPTPSQGFPRPSVHNTDPWLPVQFSREQ